MAYLSGTKKTTLETRLATYNTLLDNAYAALAAAENSEMTVGSYRLDTGEGSQAVTERSLESIQTRIEWLERKIKHLEEQLAGTGVVRFTMKRRFN